MTVRKKITQVFWNHHENRLRALWRLGVHTLLVLILTTLFMVGLLFLGAIFDIATGADLQDVIAGTGPITLIESPWINMVIAPLATLLSVFTATFLTGRWIDRRRFSKFGIAFSRQWWVDFAFGLGLGALLMGFIFLVGWFSGSLRVTGFFEVNSPDASFGLGIIQALVFFVFVGVYEELLSRGYHLINLAEGLNHRLLGERGALLLAYALSSLIFGVLHLANPNASWISMTNITLAGIFLGLGMVLTGSLAISIGLHITWNFFQGNVFGFAVSGIQTGVSVIGTETVSNPWLVGGAFGPESGALSVAAMLLGGILTILWIRRKHTVKLHTDLAVYESVSKDSHEPGDRAG